MNGSRRRRVALGSGTNTTEVNKLLRQFKEMQKLMRSGAMANVMGRAGGGRRSKKKGGRTTPSLKGAGSFN